MSANDLFPNKKPKLSTDEESGLFPKLDPYPSIPAPNIPDAIPLKTQQKKVATNVSHKTKGNPSQLFFSALNKHEYAEFVVTPPLYQPLNDIEYNQQRDELRKYTTNELFNMPWTDAAGNRINLNEASLILTIGEKGLYWSMSLTYGQQIIELPIFLEERLHTPAKQRLILVSRLCEFDFLLNGSSIKYSESLESLLIKIKIRTFDNNDVVLDKLYLKRNGSIMSPFLSSLNSPSMPPPTYNHEPIPLF